MGVNFGRIKKIAQNQTLERDQTYRAAFSEVPGSGKFIFLSEFWGLKSLAPQLKRCTNDDYIIRKIILMVYKLLYAWFQSTNFKLPLGNFFRNSHI
ncbi:hypothetical protein DO021_21935 [Desulfobacter hydrogenophilus]|uniref:Uncharacterized protein n=1 Tax=Desulfobacter hydrogenophilus TaxID=2291 RepID=A0A328F930_9BACT|nr:hypothetical protein DO021_21935 [Desulfobacter hydrogenophilus]